MHYDPNNDLYQLLGVKPTASAEALRRAKKQRMRECHPDLNPACSRSAQLARRVNAAAQLLLDEDRRSAYDQARREYYRRRDQRRRALPKAAPPRAAGGDWQDKYRRDLADNYRPGEVFKTFERIAREQFDKDEPFWGALALFAGFAFEAGMANMARTTR